MNFKLPFFNALLLIAFMSCSDSTSDEFDGANPDAEAKYIKTITVLSAQEGEEATVTVNYDANDRVSSISNGTDSSVFVYNNNELTNISGDGDNLNIEELYDSPYNAFEVGEVTSYDSNGNPKTIAFSQTEYDYENNIEEEVEYTAEITYDANPNPYFYTLEAAGIIDVLDNVDLHLTMNTSSDQVVQARLLFPLNNITGIQYKDENGVLIFELDADYVYNSADYPISGTVVGTDYYENYEGEIETETSIFSANYTYRD
ncbi:hypothetical protein H7F37_11355 [Winogradskyella sp. PAMC22761]|nr:hypothetical protein H7F37_11355 [Winogradskyella sp. PAMC22761]